MSKPRKRWQNLACHTPCCATAGTPKTTASAPPALEHGVFIGAAGEGKIASATRADYAAAAAKVIAEEGHAGKVYELAGDHGWTLSELAAELSKQSGKPVAYQNLSEADFAAALKSVGLPAGLADMLADSDVGASKAACLTTAVP